MFAILVEVEIWTGCELKRPKTCAINAIHSDRIKYPVTILQLHEVKRPKFQEFLNEWKAPPVSVARSYTEHKWSEHY